ncbi:MAG: peptide deformylase, partial [Alphaproteobacteria bacterium]|nr:peptide deformylase [Alphaproteobacteria bacterium]
HRHRPEAVLKQVAKPVEKVDDEIRTLLDDMLDTMYNAHGIGLAANQVGVLKRVIVVDVAEREGHERGQPMKFVNPEIISASPEMSVYQEGCLSLPQQYSDVERPAEVTVRYLDENGKQQELHATGILATCIQHEIDHINGVLFVDHISKLKRDMIIKKLEKAKKRGDFVDIYAPHDHHHDHHHVHGEHCNH